MMMKIIGGISTEIINMIKMGQASKIEDVVKDFIAFEIICNIDNVMATTIFQRDISHEMQDNKIVNHRD